ncbi:MAG TPA: 23S rRNA (guanosine(2251)-2'-O)-methyltransferase RlmB, partial [Coxiellaceae bacterium]|nr:23S rRNA (guanosine(2251)-2'-O)-methyltransferase RlmB [Coxiellaceae bacterium]
MNNKIIFGLHAAQAAMEKQTENIETLWIQDSRHDERVNEILQWAKRKGIPVQMLSRQALDQHTHQAVHQGIVVVLKGNKEYSEKDLVSLIESAAPNVLLLILDGVQDPHNVGACLRTANGLGVNAVIAPKDKSAGLTPTARKVACGAAELTPFITVTNLARTLKYLKEQGVWLIGLEGKAEQFLHQLDLKGSYALVMGNEGQGLRHLTREHCDYWAKLPLQGGIESY